MNKHKKAMIIGAGIAGCATAYHLASAGWQVTLIEREDNIAQAASGNPFAVLYPRLSDANNVLDQFALAAYAHALALLNTLPNSNQFFKACGLLQIACNTREQQRIEKVASREFSNIIVDALTPAQASEIAGVHIDKPALYFPKAGYLQPQAYCQALTQHPNIQLQFSTAALSLEQRDNQWCVHTEQTAYEADVVVICNAHDTAQFTQTAHLPLQTVRGQMSMVQADTNSAALQCILCGDGYVTPSIDQQHAVGATFTPNSVDTDISQQDNVNNLQMAQTLSEDLKGLDKVIAARAALRTSSADYLPFIGPVIDDESLKQTPPKHLSPTPSLPLHAGLFVNLAHGSKGFSTAPLGAEMIAHYVSNQHSLPIDLLNTCQPNRFLLRDMGLKRLNPAVVAQALSAQP